MSRAYTLGLYEKAMPKEISWREKLEVAKSAGYDFVEISIDESEEKIQRVYMSQEERLEMIQCMCEVGLPIRSMCVSALTKYALGDAEELLCNRGMEIVERAIILAADLGIRIVMIPGYDVYYGQSTADTQARFIDNLKKVAMIAAKYGVLVGLETMENDFMNTVWKAMYYVKQVDSPYLGIYPDSGNTKNAAIFLGNNEILDLISGKGHIYAVHLKETVPGIFREITYGTGHVDFQGVIETAWAMGVRRYVTEFWYTGNKEWKQDIVDAHNMAAGILDSQRKVG